MNYKYKKWEFLFDIYNIYIAKKEPVSLILYVTEKCNARCPHCFVDFSKNKKELTFSQIEKITNLLGIVFGIYH